MVPSQVWSMNWYRPFAEEVDACADGLKLDSIFAVVSRYSKLVPVDWAAWRIAPVICGAALATAGLTAIVLRLCETLGSCQRCGRNGSRGPAEHGELW